MATKNYPDGQEIKVGDTVFLNRQGKYGPETYRVVSTDLPESTFVRVAILVEGQSQKTEDVPAAFLRLVNRQQ
jgi:hypothetical protein